MNHCKLSVFQLHLEVFKFLKSAQLRLDKNAEDFICRHYENLSFSRFNECSSNCTDFGSNHGLLLFLLIIHKLLIDYFKFKTNSSSHEAQRSQSNQLQYALL
jgi:hypothetical protein